MDVLGWLFGLISVVGTLSTIHYGRKSYALEQSRRKLDWDEFQASAQDLARQVVQTKFQPDVLYTPGLPGATFANLLRQQLPGCPPVFVGLNVWKAAAGSQPSAISGFWVLETSKWFVYVPEELASGKYERILIVDSFALSGDFLRTVKEKLVERGVLREQIKTLAVVTTKVALESFKGPDLFWMEVPDSSFYFPWGKAQ